jgi:protein-S-isoprenylcysteine O-methyltransferase Ste14
MRFMPSRAGRDLLARTPLVLLAINQLVRTWQDGHVAGVLTAVSNAIALWFLLRRRLAVTVDYSVSAWTVAIAATVIPMFLQPGGAALVPDVVSASIASAGVLVTSAGLLALGHSFGVVPSNRGIVSSGIYRWVRHPLYAGYFMTHVGFCLANPTTTNLLIWMAGDAFQLVRISYEERLLARDAAYRQYQTRVRWRLLPGFY